MLGTLDAWHCPGPAWHVSRDADQMPGFCLSTVVWLHAGGQQRKVALVAALLSRPQLLILDEPTNHLDMAVGSAKPSP